MTQGVKHPPRDLRHDALVESRRNAHVLSHVVFTNTDASLPARRHVRSCCVRIGMRASPPRRQRGSFSLSLVCQLPVHFGSAGFTVAGFEGSFGW